MPNRFRYLNSSPEVIRLVVMMFVKHPLSLRHIEDLLVRTRGRHPPRDGAVQIEDFDRESARTIRRLDHDRRDSGDHRQFGRAAASMTDGIAQRLAAATAIDFRQAHCSFL